MAAREALAYERLSRGGTKAYLWSELFCSSRLGLSGHAVRRSKAVRLVALDERLPDDALEALADFTVDDHLVLCP